MSARDPRDRAQRIDWNIPHDSGTGLTVIPGLIFAATVVGLATLYLAWRFVDVRKFLAGAFFVSAGIQFYLYLADVSVPLLGTGLTQTPKVSLLRSIPNFIFFVLCFYFGFIANGKSPARRDRT